ncbi:MAG: IS481 family transposase [Acidiferrobacterales bacterium]
MPWNTVSAMSLRKEFVMLALAEGGNRRQLCRRFGISPKTGYKWLHRYQSEGPGGLQARSRRPHHSPQCTDVVIAQRTIALRRDHPDWGGRKLHRRLLDLGHRDVPAPSTITDILRRHGLLDPATAGQARDYQCFEHPYPNGLWQIDFKGHFALDHGRCHPLTVLDDHSRFNLALRACANEQGATVQAELTATFRHYGLPERMLMDNGAPWGHATHSRITPLTVWLMRLGIGVTHARPYHPQTLGKDERFHRTLKREVLRHAVFHHLEQCQRRFDHWRAIYNLERPHEALALDVPAQHYTPSRRTFPETPPPIEYGPGDTVRKVQAQGELFYHGHVYRIPKALRGYPVTLRPTDHDGIVSVYFCHTQVADIDLRNPYK